tara:strand:+ start:14741 stop:16717 length:1977 start_codon:yes stop_codon:yes gene_type:complete
MASVYTNDLRLEEIGTGEQSGTWGDTTNTNLELIAEGFSYGAEAIANASTHTITLADGTSDEARSLFLKCTGGGQACTVTLAPNTISKVWIVENATSATLTFTQGSGANVAVAAGKVKAIATDGGGSGAIVYDLFTDLSLAGSTSSATSIQTPLIEFTDGDDAITIADGGGVTMANGITSTAAANTFGATSFNDADITNVGSIQLDSIAGDGDTNTSITFSGSDVITVATGGTTAMTIDASQNVTIAGDLTITGDDLVMGTNTAGHLLIADGTNFNPTGVGDLSEISTVANDDVLLAVDTSGGGLKKVTRSTLVAGLATSSGISNIVEDTSPQLGANLDTNSHNILIDDAHFIGDENGNEQIIFQTTSSAVNQFDVTNAATGSPPKISATGGDSNIDFDLEAKGTGHVTVRGNSNSGAIQFNCEANTHGQIVIAQPHSAGVTNTLTLPAGSSSTLVSLVSTDTLTNKTLTEPKFADGGFIADANGAEMLVFQTVSSAANAVEITNAAASGAVVIGAMGSDSNVDIDITPKGTGEINIAAGNLNYASTAITSTGAELNLVDGSSAGTIVNSKAVIYGSSGEVNATTLQIGGTSITTTAAEINLIDGGTSRGTTALADGDGILVNDAGTMRMTTVETVRTYMSANSATTGKAIAMALVFG